MDSETQNIPKLFGKKDFAGVTNQLTMSEVDSVTRETTNLIYQSLRIQGSDREERGE